MSDQHEYVTSPELPAALGPYSLAVTLGNLVIVSGQGAVDPATGKLSGPDVESQTEQVFKNIETILKHPDPGLAVASSSRFPSGPAGRGMLAST